MNNRNGAVPADSEAGIEKRLQEAGLSAPRLTPDDIEATIVAEAYYQFPGTVMTVCCLTLKNGYYVVGESAPASPENFNADVGRDISRRRAKDKIWSLEGYLLREKLNQAVS